MLKTLQAYLTRELIRATLLSVVAFTLLLTVLAIIQPLRKMGLGTEQVIRLFGFTLPAMVSFTLPVATLFAATIVYGRFSQDNELLACRASGIATLSLLRPALGLGAVVTVISLVLSNFVAPNLATMAGLAVQRNLRGFVYHPLRHRSYIEFGKYGRRHTIHADLVDAETDTLHGVVYAQTRRKKPKPGDANAPPPSVTLLAASRAYMRFPETAGDAGQVAIQLVNPSVIRTNDRSIVQESSQRFVLPLENPIREKASWYSWTRLLRTLARPSLHAEVARRLGDVRQWICSDMLAEELRRSVASPEGYGQLRKGDETFQIQAPKMETDAEGAAVLSAETPPGGAVRPVRVTVRRGGRIVQRVRGRSGKVVAAWSPATGRARITLEIEGDVTVEAGTGPLRRVLRPDAWRRGEIPVPADLRARADGVALADICRRPEQFTANRKILAQIRALTDKRIPKLQGALIAELHARIAYGLSCFLMVAMGAALGLIFRGGQFISAFVISVVPAAAVIAVLMMGKEMVRNPDVEMAYGLASVWGGIVALLAANVLIYWHLARK